MAFKLKLGKRADISITILVIGVFIVCSLAIISFLLYTQQTQGSFANPEIIENLSSQLSDFYFYIHSGMPQQQAADIIGAQIQGTQLILSGKQMPIKNIFQNNNPQPIISVEYIIDLSH